MIQDLLKTIKNKCGAEGDTRNHAKAMTIKDMEKLMNWSEGLIPHRMAGHEFQVAAELAEAAKHLFMRAFMTSGFTLWTRSVHSILLETSLNRVLIITTHRNFELCQLQWKDIEMWCKGGPYESCYYVFKLMHWKGWQKMGKGPL
jgi:hypothetical protein